MGRRYEGDRARAVWDRQKERWCVEVYRNGRRSRIACADGASQAEAERAARRLGADLKAGRIDAPGTWAEAMDAFVAHREREGDGAASSTTLRHRLRAVAKTLGPKSDPLALTLEDATKHVDARLELGRSPVTIGAELDAVAELQRWAVAQEWIPTATWAKARRPDTSRVPPREHLLPSEVGPFLRAAIQLGDREDTDWTAPAWSTWPAAAVLLMSGLRTGEMRRLRVAHFDWHPKMVIVYVRSTRSGRAKSKTSQRPVVITSKLGRRILRKAFQGQPLDAVCFQSIRNPGQELPERTHWFIDRVVETCELAGIRRVATHGLRHSTGTLLAMLPGVGLNGAQPWLGHADRRTTERIYSHADVGSRMATAVELGDAIDALHAGRAAFRVIQGGRGRDEAFEPPKKRRARA